MSFRANTSAVPREEIQAAIMEGAGLNRHLIWDKILPPLALNKRTAHLPKLTLAGAELARIVERVTAEGVDVPRMTAKIGEFTLSPEIRKQEIGIPLEHEMDYADLFSVVVFYSRQIGDRVLSLTMELQAAKTIFSTGTFGAATNSKVAYTEANLETISLISDIFAALNRVADNGEVPNAIVIPSQVLERCSQSPIVKEFVAGSLAPGADVTATAIESAFRKQGWDVTIHVGRAQYNAAPKNSVSLARVWSNDYIWVGRSGYRNEVSDEGVPIIDGVGATAYWEKYGLFMGETYEDKPKDQQVVRGAVTGNPTIFNANAGTLIATQWA